MSITEIYLAPLWDYRTAGEKAVNKTFSPGKQRQADEPHLERCLSVFFFFGDGCAACMQPTPLFCSSFVLANYNLVVHDSTMINMQLPDTNNITPPTKTHRQYIQSRYITDRLMRSFENLHIYAEGDIFGNQIINTSRVLGIMKMYFVVTSQPSESRKND